MPYMRCGKDGKGWKWGKHGHCYPSKAGAHKQQMAILATGWREHKRKSERKKKSSK